MPPDTKPFALLASRLLRAKDGRGQHQATKAFVAHMVAHGTAPGTAQACATALQAMVQPLRAAALPPWPALAHAQAAAAQPARHAAGCGA